MMANLHSTPNIVNILRTVQNRENVFERPLDLFIKNRSYGYDDTFIHLLYPLLSGSLNEYINYIERANLLWEFTWHAHTFIDNSFQLVGIRLDGLAYILEIRNYYFDKQDHKMAKNINNIKVIIGDSQHNIESPLIVNNASFKQLGWDLMILTNYMRIPQ
jgi:hypothetical protein